MLGSATGEVLCECAQWGRVVSKARVSAGGPPWSSELLGSGAKDHQLEEALAGT